MSMGNCEGRRKHLERGTSRPCRNAGRVERKGRVYCQSCDPRSKDAKRLKGRRVAHLEDALRGFFGTCTCDSDPGKYHRPSCVWVRAARGLGDDDPPRKPDEDHPLVDSRCSPSQDLDGQATFSFEPQDPG